MVSFKFINEDEEIFNLSGTDLQNRLVQIYGDEYAGSLIEVTQDFELISLHGFISRPSFTKKTKQDQFLFLNKRFVINKALSYAVHMAYEDLIEKGDYPNFFLFLMLDPRKFDVNVHPSKLEVKFEDERAVFGFIRKGVHSALKDNDLVIEASLDTKADSKLESESNVITKSGFNRKSAFEERLKFIKEPAGNSTAKIHELFRGNRSAPHNVQDNEPLEESTPGGESEPARRAEEKDEFSGKNSIWQFQKKYIMYQLENTLMIIDQHAAHERILYEQALDRLESNADLSQQLLIPLYVELNPVDFEVAKTVEKDLRSLGFDIEILAKRKIKLKGVPSDVRLGDEGKILQELIDEFKENDVKLNLEKRDNLAKSYSCKHAIKAGDRLNENEMLNLIDKLFLTKMPYVCPHGRPTIVKISMDELDRKFARTGY
jgi:DNA mismatch repair protein MutL